MLIPLAEQPGGFALVFLALGCCVVVVRANIGAASGILLGFFIRIKELFYLNCLQVQRAAMSLIDVGSINLLNLAELVGADKHGQHAIPFGIGFSLAPGDKLILGLFDFCAEDFALIILLDGAVDFRQSFGERT